MPLSHPSHLFLPYSKARVSRTFPPITNQLSLTPERSPSPLYLILNRTFSVSFDEGADCISNAMARNAGVTVVQSASRQSSSHLPLNSERDNNCSEPDNSNIEPSSDSEGIPENRKIPKSKGEVGHPGGNGYSLSNKLKWDKTVYEAVQKGVHRLADAHLNNNFGISKQDDRDVWIANQEFPILRKYVVYWPARDMVKLYLKTSSERACRDLPPSTRKNLTRKLRCVSILIFLNMTGTLALVILGKAQLAQDAFDSRQLPNFLANINDGNVPEMLDFQDIGIDWASEIFVRQSHAKIEDVTGFVEKHRAIEAIAELAVKETGDFCYAPMNFENIWNMVDVLKQQQLDRDGLYLLIYFLALANRNSPIPPSLPLGICNLMLEERDEILARAAINSRLVTSPASERHQENMTSPIILTPTGVGRLPPQRDSNPFRNQLKGISPSVSDSTRSLSTSTTDTADESQSQPSFPQAPIQVLQSTPISNTGAGSSQMPEQSFQPPLAGQGQGNTQRTPSNANSSAPLTSHMSTSGSQKTPNIPMDTSHSYSRRPTTNPFQSSSTSGAQLTGQPSGAQRGGQPLDNNGTIPAGMSLEEISQAISGHILELTVAQLMNTGQCPRRSDIAFGLPVHQQSKPEGLTKLNDDIRKLTNKLMGWNRDEQPYTIPPARPTKQELDDFVMGQTSGPTADNFRLDLCKLSKDHEEHNLQKRWNNRASVVFARDFLRLCEGNPRWYIVDSQRESFLAQKFTDKLRRLKDVHQLQSRLSVATEQDRYRILKEQQDGQKPGRHQARRVELFEFRKRLLEFPKDVPSAYMDVLLMLGVNGMSSEDTDPESRVKPYKFYHIPKLYARPNVLGANSHRGGNVRRTRIGDHANSVHVGPVPQYPKCFYDLRFFEKRPGALQVLQSNPEWIGHLFYRNRSSQDLTT
ncbi:hypothetical protein M422DRAFT_251528 [Sphaerobolus stellatus SS14]|uniref:Uncharacterized protein n=1 Tax=Sphaerobolus stellatus (strain SS14) TaxID=990650 RepID=A0A0C9VD61_SPHS4|nr:hypothetical protein M422DRAFT_251528 [Sphaerobolus stellatus SS14]